MLLFLEIFIAIFIAEMGDKTQLLMIALNSRYRLRDILIGAFLSILALNGIAVVLGATLSSFIPMYIIKIIAGLAFFGFAASTVHELREGGGEEEHAPTHSVGHPVLIVFGTFFLAELGDKTQLAAITFAANAGTSSALIIWMACSLGLFTADLIGMMAGSLIKAKVGERSIAILAAAIFAVFGVITLIEGLGLMGVAA